MEPISKFRNLINSNGEIPGLKPQKETSEKDIEPDAQLPVGSEAVGYVAGWQPMETAPQNDDILVRNFQTKKEYECHYAEGGGEDQPCFGPAWFYWNGCMYMEIDLKHCKWKPLTKKTAT